MDDTLDKEDVFMIFYELYYKTHLCKSCSREDDFFSKFGRRQAADNEFPARVTCYGLLRMPSETSFPGSLFLLSTPGEERGETPGSGLGQKST